jgi:hypothetical protein
METKPFSLQSPEKIAAEYGGNKQKIASATQLGLVDPTAALLAGMFIDRMRSAQVQEQNPQQTVAQQVFAPPAPPAPPQGMPPQGMPPQGMPPQGMPPQGAPPQGMPQEAPPAMMADGGLASLPVPDSMFDEPSNGSYANGGIVAFDDGGAVGTGPLVDPNYERDVRAYSDINTRMLGDAQGPAMKEMIAENARIRSPEGAAAQKKQDMWATLAQIGATMASTPGSFLQGVGAGVNKALPGAIEQNKERKAEQRAALQSSATMETAQYSAKAAAMQNAQKMYADAQALRERGLEREARALEQKADLAARYAQIASSERISGAQIASQRDIASRLTGDERMFEIYRNASPEQRKVMDQYRSGSYSSRLEASSAQKYLNMAAALKKEDHKFANLPPDKQTEILREIAQQLSLADGGGSGAGGSGSVGNARSPWATTFIPQ